MSYPDHSISFLNLLLPIVGVEPTTFRLQVRSDNHAARIWFDGIHIKDNLYDGDDDDDDDDDVDDDLTSGLPN